MAMTIPGAAAAKPVPPVLSLSVTSAACGLTTPDLPEEVPVAFLSFDFTVSVEGGSAYLTNVNTWADKWMAMSAVNAIDGVDAGYWEPDKWSLWHGDNISVANWSNEQDFPRRSMEVNEGAPWTGSFVSTEFTRHGFTNAYVFADPTYQGWWRVGAWARASAKGGNLWSEGGDDSDVWVDCTAGPGVGKIVSNSEFPASLEYCQKDSPTGAWYMWGEVDGIYQVVPCVFDYKPPWTTE